MALLGGLHLDAVVGVGPRQAHQALDLHVGVHLAAGGAAAGGVLAGVLHGADPRTEEVGPEGDDHPRVVEAVVRDGALAEHLLVSVQQGAAGNGVVLNDLSIGVGLAELTDGGEQGGAQDGVADDPDLAVAVQSGGDLTVDDVPALVVLLVDGPVGDAVHQSVRSVEAARVVHTQNGGLGAGAGATAGEGAEGVALDLDGPAFPRLDQDGNVVATLDEGGSKVSSYAGHDGIGLGDVGNGLADGDVTRSDRCRRNAEAEVLEEVAAAGFQPGGIGGLGSGRDYFPVGRLLVVRAVLQLIGA